MLNPFERFYDTAVEIYSRMDNGYSDGDTKTYLGKIICDLQPYTGDTEDKLYGLSSEKQYKLYADNSAIIKEGNIVKFAEGYYMIVNVKEWRFGTVALIRSVGDED